MNYLNSFILFIKENMKSNQDIASDYIRKHGWVVGIYPMRAYIEYKYIDKLKELGVEYEFKPLKDININEMLSKYLNDYLRKLKIKNIDRVNVNEHNNNTLVEMYLDSLSEEEYIEVKNEFENKINDFNSIMGSDFFIKDVGVNLSSESRIKKEMRESSGNLDDHSSYDSIQGFLHEDGYTYEKMGLFLERGEDEEEYLAEIKMVGLYQPKMKE